MNQEKDIQVSVKEAYGNAVTLLESGNYELTEKQFPEILKNYPKGRLNNEILPGETRRVISRRRFLEYVAFGTGLLVWPLNIKAETKHYLIVGAKRGKLEPLNAVF